MPPVLRKAVLPFLVAFVGIYALALAWVYLTQDRRLYFPPPPAQAPFDVRFNRPDGTVLGGWVVPGPDPGAALVLFGGNAQPLEPWRTRQGLAGCTDRTLVLVPYRGYEGNPGQPREAALINDGAALLDWAGERFERVGVLGISLGSGVAVGAALQTRTPLDVLALGTPYDRMDLVARDLMPWVFPTLLMRDRYPSVERVATIKAPVTVMRARDDTLIREARTRALIDAAPGEVPETVAPGGHDSAWRTLETCAWLRHATAVAPSP